MAVAVEERIEVAVPPAAAWEAMVDWERQSDWVAFTRVRVTTPGGHGVGEEFEAVTKIAGLGFRDPIRVTSWQPPHRVDVAHLGRVVRGTGTFLVEPGPTSGASVVVWREDLELPFGALGRLGFAVVRPIAGRMLARSLRKFARSVEAEHAAGA